MTARLGNALYALGCLLAVAIILAQAAATMALSISPEDALDPRRWMLTAFYALVFWLVGRACRYVLVGR